MTSETLRNIMAVEDELHAREQAEKTRAEKWLTEQERSAQSEFRRRQAELAEALEQARKGAREKAERLAAETVRLAELRARHLSRFDEEVLRRIVGRHLVDIVTGRLP